MTEEEEKLEWYAWYYDKPCYRAFEQLTDRQIQDLLLYTKDKNDKHIQKPRQ